MHTDQELIDLIRSMIAPGLPLGLHTLKTVAVTADRGRIEPIVRDMVAAGEIIQLKKDRFIKKEN